MRELSRRQLARAMAAMAMATAAAMPARTRAAGPVRVNFAVATSTLTLGYPYLTVPQGLGWWTDQGVAVNIILTQGSAQVIQLLATGNADLGLINPEGVIIGQQKRGLALRSIGSLGNVASYKIAVDAASGIRTVADLKGRKIGVFSMASGGIYYLQAKLHEAHVDPATDVTLLPVGFGATAADAIQNHRVDALVLWLAAYAGLENAGMKLRYLPMEPWERDLYSWNLVAFDKVIETRAQAITPFLRGVAEGTEFTAVRPEAAVAEFWRSRPETINAKVPRPQAFANDLRLVNSSMEQVGVDQPGLPAPPNRIWLQQKPAGWENVQNYMKIAGLIDRTEDVTRYFTDQFTAAANDFDHAAVDKQARSLALPV